jgi:hypothetical protein
LSCCRRFTAPTCLKHHHQEPPSTAMPAGYSHACLTATCLQHSTASAAGTLLVGTVTTGLCVASWFGPSPTDCQYPARMLQCTALLDTGCPDCMLIQILFMIRMLQYHVQAALWALSKPPAALTVPTSVTGTGTAPTTSGPQVESASECCLRAL